MTTTLDALDWWLAVGLGMIVVIVGLFTETRPSYLVGQGVLPTVVMAWGGWESWDTFRNHYIGEMSPEVDKREQEKVPWLSDGTVDLGDVETHTMPVSGKSWVGR